MVPLHITPGRNPETDEDAHTKSSFQKLNKNRDKLIEIYRNEFVADLTRQATNCKQKYAPVKHQKLEIGDLELLKETNTKCINFPMGIIQEVSKFYR